MISNNYIPEKVNDYNVYQDGNKMIGLAAEVELPSIKMKTSTIEGVGVGGEIDSPTIGQFESLEAKLKFNTLYSSASMEMEAFYAQAKDADYIIYNSTVDGELKSRDELLTKSQLLENFKAVQNGNVYCTTQNIYQSTMELGTIIADIHNMLQGDDQSLTYIYKLE